MSLQLIQTTENIFCKFLVLLWSFRGARTKFCIWIFTLDWYIWIEFSKEISSHLFYPKSVVWNENLCAIFYTVWWERGSTKLLHHSLIPFSILFLCAGPQGALRSCFKQWKTASAVCQFLPHQWFYKQHQPAWNCLMLSWDKDSDIQGWSRQTMFHTCFHVCCQANVMFKTCMAYNKNGSKGSKVNGKQQKYLWYHSKISSQSDESQKVFLNP